MQLDVPLAYEECKLVCRMICVIVEVCRYVSNDFPGFVECLLVDAYAQEWLFIEKVPVVTVEDLDANSSYPRPGIIACELVERRVGPDSREVVVIDTETPWGVQATTGATRFIVYPEQLRELAGQ